MYKSREFLFSVMLMMVLSGCQPAGETITRYSESKELMGTIIQLDVCHTQTQKSDIAQAYADAWGRLDEINIYMNVYNKDSDISRINTAKPGSKITVRRDTFDIIDRALRFYHISRRTFDITVWPLISLWRGAAEKGTKPDQAALQDLIVKLGPGNVSLHEDFTISRKNNTVQLDLGGNAKGYAVDEVARIFREHGFNRFYIDAGGDVYVGGMNCEGQLWRIGIRDPRDRSEILEVVHLSNQAVATSGNYERFLTIDGETFSHIIDPVTGHPQKEVVSASVISSSAERADVFATAMTVLKHDDGIELMHELGDDYAALILEKADKSAKMERYQTDNFDSLLKPQL